jgi:arylsulfatase A-like enzyme
MKRMEDQPQYTTFALGLEFIETNKNEDRWFLQIETFDPHEPFFTQKEFQDLYPHDWDPSVVCDWPPYAPVNEPIELIRHIHCMYASLVTMCDLMLGKILDVMDKENMWEDTMLIVNTDHGFLMGEHDWWAKTIQPWFQEVAHIPMWIWDPRVGVMNEKREAVVQTIDLPATILKFFDQKIPKDFQGKCLNETIKNDTKVRKGALFGVHGGQVNLTDGEYVYMRGAQNSTNSPLFEYLLMPTRMARRFAPSELLDWEKHQGFSFTKGVPVMKVPARRVFYTEQDTVLWNVQKDPKQKLAVRDEKIETEMIKLLVELMNEAEAPPEQYTRLGIPDPKEMNEENIEKSLKASQYKQMSRVELQKNWTKTVIGIAQQEAKL